MPIMEISVIPVGTGSPSVSKYVADIIKLLDKEKVQYEFNSMGTVIESSSLEFLFSIAKRIHNTVLNDEVNRVVTSIKIDDRKDKVLSMKGKVTSVKENLVSK